MVKAWRLPVSLNRPALLIAIAGSLFYWYGYRPERIRADCDMEATAAVMAMLKSQPTPAEGDQELIGQGLFAKSDKEEAYKNCLRRHGIRF